MSQYGVESLFKDVKYFNGKLYRKIDSKGRVKLLNNSGELKNFIVIDVTSDGLYSGEDFREFIKQTEGLYKNASNLEINSHLVNTVLESIRYKVYKSIKLR